MSKPVRFTWALIAFALLLAATGTTLANMFSMPGASHTGPLEPLTAAQSQLAENLRRHVVAIASREHNMFKPDALESAAVYIESELKGFGYPVERQPYATRMGTARNLEAALAGESDEVLVVGAHYDSVAGTAGANDNGSGVAATIELARLLRQAKLRRTVKFVLFANEEPPFFQGPDMGSVHFAQRARARGERIMGMFSLETIGYYSDVPGSQKYPPPLATFYPDTGNFIGFVSNVASRALLYEAIGAFRRHARFPSEGIAAPAFISGIDWSDHASFWSAGYPAVMVTDTAPFRYPHYHLASDTPDKIDYDRLARVVSGLEAMLRELAGYPSMSCSAPAPGTMPNDGMVPGSRSIIPSHCSIGRRACRPCPFGAGIRRYGFAPQRRPAPACR